MLENLNIDISNEVDLINIKNLPEIISDYLQDKSCKKYNNLRKFYSSLLDYFSEEIKDSYLNRILKYLSNESSSQINLIDDINENIYDKELYKFSSDLVKTINQFEDNNILYESLNRKINFVFYDGDDYSRIKEYHNNQEYVDFIFSLLKHSFEGYKISLPGIVAKRLYINSRTLKIDVPNYIRSLYASYKLGNLDAAILLYGSISKYDFNIATKILIDSKESDVSLWIIAYNLEKNKLDKETISLIKNKYNYIFNYSDEFIDNVFITDKGRKSHDLNTLLLAYKMYYYCYKKYEYTKAGNSLGKLLIFGIVSYKNDKESIKRGKEYLKLEMKKGNVDAITNMGIYFYTNPSDNEYSYDDLKKILKTAALFADVVGSYYYAKILFDEGKYKECLEPLTFAFEQNYGQACLLMGKYYELKNEYEKVIEIYKKGIVNKYYDCAYYLSLIYFNEKTELGNQIAYNYLRDYINLFTDDIKEKATKLLNEKR